MIEDKVERVIVRTGFDEAAADDIDYWMSRTPTERIEAGEYLRRRVYGDDQIDAGVLRILTTAERLED